MRALKLTSAVIFAIVGNVITDGGQTVPQPLDEGELAGQRSLR